MVTMHFLIDRQALILNTKAKGTKTQAKEKPAEPKRRRDGRLTKAERTKLSILQSAELVFAEQGYERTTLDDIGERANVLGTAVLYHFKSKKFLYHETLRFAFMPISKAITSDMRQPLSLEEMITRIGIDLIRESVTRPNGLKLFLREAAAGTPESLTLIGPMIGKALQSVIDSIELQTSPRKNSTTLDPVLILSMLIGVNSFYFSGFPTIMGDKLPYDPLDPDRIKKLEDTMGLFAKFLIKASTEA